MYIASVPLENQSDVCNGLLYGPILWVMCKGPIRWEYAVCTKDQSYGDTMQNLMHVQMTNPTGQLHVPMHNLNRRFYVKYEGLVIWELNMHKVYLSKGILVQRICATMYNSACTNAQQ